ncbi:MAG TPA: glycoside-pentoside-hexuronide (GPH):cation symporter [Mobilitalea sp.]|nr:glycoside-pentoside-hexuronide (GPH):cation symporter [Mobilitalea sp.]
MRLTLKEKASYGIGAVGKDMVYAIVSGFLMYYYNTVLGISATFIGVLFMVARIFDALNDPFMGIIVEKTNTKMGKFRPWLLIGTVLSAISLYGMYSVPRSLSGTSLLVYTSAAYIIWCTTYTLMDIPYWSMLPAITQDSKDRENVSVIARSCAGFGYAIPTALTMVLVPILGGGEERRGFQIFAVIISVLFIMFISITVKNVKEKTASYIKAPTIKEMFSSLFRNDQALVVVITIVVFNASLYITNNLAVYFFKYDIGNGALFGVFGTIGGAAQIISMTMLPALRKLFKRMTIFVGAIVTAIIGYALLFLLGTLSVTNIILLSIAAIIIFFGFGLATVLTTVFLADTVDYGEWKTKQRSESVIFSMQTFVVQLASAFSVLIAGVGLDLIHLDTKAKVQTSATLFGMRVIMIIIPILGLLFSIFYFRRKYKLTDAYMEKITKEIQENHLRDEKVTEINTSSNRKAAN